MLVGDHEQLPSVGPGLFFRSVLDCEQVPRTELDSIFRQTEGSSIIGTAHQIRRGMVPSLPSPSDGEHCSLIETGSDYDRCRSAIVDLVTNPGRFLGTPHIHPVRDILVIAPMRKRPCGVNELNALLGQALNPNGAPYRVGSREFRIGDKVMQTRNSYSLDVVNGDLGIIEEIDVVSKKMIIDFGARVEYPFAYTADLTPAFCQTVHAAQGTEAPVVIMCVLDAHAFMLQRNLLYTGATRARERLVFIGSERAIRMAVTNNHAQERRSPLASRLRYLSRRAA